MNMFVEDDKLKKELAELCLEHSQLDKKISALLSERVHDQLLLQRLKRRKLWLKDRTKSLREILCDDIIA
jgi:hypothetical protein